MSLPEGLRVKIMSLALEMYLSERINGKTYVECVKDIKQGLNVLDCTCS